MFWERFFVSRKKYDSLTQAHEGLVKGNLDLQERVKSLESKMEDMTKQVEIPEGVLEQVEKAVATSVEVNNEDAKPFKVDDIVDGIDTQISSLKLQIGTLKSRGANSKGRKILNEHVAVARKSIKTLEGIKKPVVKAKKSSKSRKSGRK